MSIERIETPKNIYYLSLRDAYDSLPENTKPSQKKDMLRRSISILEDSKDNVSNINELVNFKNSELFEGFLIPLWLYILIKYEGLFPNLKTIEDREKKVKDLVDLTLSIKSLNFKVESLRSATYACRRSKCYYSSYRLASVDPFCGAERDLTIPFSCGVTGKSIRDTQMAVKILEEIPDIESKINYPSGDRGYTALHFACAFSNYQLVNWLIGHGANINKKNYAGHTPIWHCLPGVNPNIKTEQPRSSAMEIIELLLKSGANPHLKDDKGNVFVDHLTKSPRYQEGNYTYLLKMIEAIPETEEESIEEMDFGLVKEITDQRVVEHDKDIACKFLSYQIESLLKLFHSMAIYEFLPTDIVRILVRRKRIYNKALPAGSKKELSDPILEKDVKLELTEMTFNGHAPFTFDTRTKICAIDPRHRFFQEIK